MEIKSEASRPDSQRWGTSRIKDTLTRTDSMLWVLLVCASAAAMGIGLYLFMFLHDGSLQMLIGAVWMLFSLFAYAASWQCTKNANLLRAGILALTGIGIGYLGFVWVWAGIAVYLLLFGGILIVLAGIIFFSERWIPWAAVLFLYAIVLIFIEQFYQHQRLIADHYPLLPRATYVFITAVLIGIFVWEIILLRYDAKSIRNQLMRTFVSIVLLTGVYLNSFATVNAFQIGTSQSVQKLESIVTHKEIEAITWYNEVKDHLNLRLSGNQFIDLVEVLDTFSTKSIGYFDASLQLEEMFNRIVEQDDNIDNVYLVTTEGDVLISSDRSYQGRNFLSEPILDFADTSANTYLIEESQVFHAPVLLLTQKIVLPNGIVFGMIIEEISLDPLIHILGNKTGLGSTGESYLVDQRGRVYSPLSSLPGSTTGTAYLNTLPIQVFQQGGLRGSDVYSGYYGEMVVGSFQWVPALQLGILVEQGMEETLLPINLTVTSGAGLMIFSIIIAVIATYTITRGITDPLRYLVNTASRIAAGDLDVEVKDRGLGELSVLTRAIRRMTNRLREAIRELQDQVDELQNAKLSISRARDEWELTFNTIPDLIILLDREQHIHRINQAMVDYLGVSSEELIGEPCSILKQRSLEPPFLCPDPELLSLGEALTSEFKSEASDREYTLSATPLFDQHGGLVGSVHVAHDITRQKRTEQALLRANNLIAALSQVATRLAVESAPREVMETLGGELKNLGLNCFIGLVEPDQRHIQLHYASFPKNVIERATGQSSLEDIDGLTIELDKDRFGFSVEETRSPIYLPDIKPFVLGVIPDGFRRYTPNILRILEINSDTPGMIFPLIVSSEVSGVLGLWGNSLRKEDMNALAIFAEQVAVSIEKSRLLETTQELATTDQLTSVHNRRYLFDLGEQEIQRAKRIGFPLAAIMLDLDHFKQINDTHGHAFGDLVLREVASRCKQSIRDIDIFGRYGGEEFAVVLPNANIDSAVLVAERLRRVVSDMPISTPKGPIPMTVSIGIAEYSRDIEELATLLDRADTALYAAKNSGRNQVVTFPPPSNISTER